MDWNLCDIINRVSHKAMPRGTSETTYQQGPKQADYQYQQHWSILVFIHVG